MIIVKQEAGLRCVTQPDHAGVAAEILGLWRADGLPEHQRRDELLFAVREHDNGWQEIDAAPYVCPTNGGPYTFTELPEIRRRELWLRGVDRHVEQRPYAALLITRHAIGIHADRRALADWSEFFDTLTELEASLMEELEPEPDHVAEDYGWLRLADLISLQACGALSERFEEAGHRFERQGSQIAIGPFPLAGATTFSVPARWIPDRTYSSDTDLAVELAATRWKSFDVRLVPG